MNITLKQQIALAEQNFAEHVIEHQDETRLVIGRKDGSMFLTEMFRGIGGTLLIHGDGPDMAFRSYQPEMSFESLIHWVGDRDIDYISSKVLMGKKEVYDPEQARKDLFQYIEDMGDDGTDPTLKRLLKFAKDPSNEWHLQQCIEVELMGIDWSLSECLPFGYGPSTPLLNARAACRKAYALMETVKEGAA